MHGSLPERGPSEMDPDIRNLFTDVPKHFHATGLSATEAISRECDRRSPITRVCPSSPSTLGTGYKAFF
ncbi:hypothetical protein J6590_106520 [Homalodisca vitripennis]|nr:hypothetical protein J6590_106520 [Homalodisca vitripennis]